MTHILQGLTKKKEGQPPQKEVSWVLRIHWCIASDFIRTRVTRCFSHTSLGYKRLTWTRCLGIGTSEPNSTSGLPVCFWCFCLICPSQMKHLKQKQSKTSVLTFEESFPLTSPPTKTSKNFDFTTLCSILHITPQINTPPQLRLWHLRIDLMIVSANITKSSALSPSSVSWV